MRERWERQRASLHVLDEAQALAKLGSWTLDVADGSAVWSREMFRILGLDEAAGAPDVRAATLCLHPDDRDEVIAAASAALNAGRSYELAFRIVRPDGTSRRVISHGAPDRGPDGSLVRVFGTVQDITESPVLAAEALRINADLLRANEVNADVIAMLGHDIRSPLGALDGFLELLEDEGLSHEDHKHLVADARSAAHSLERMLERILGLATVDSGAILTSPVELDLGPALCEIVRDSGLEEVVGLRVEGAPRAWLDPVHLEQILDNLLSNATRYGAAPIEVHATTTTEGTVEVTVRDGGPGVASDRVATLFQRFDRTGPHQVEQGGTGFGLYMAHRLAAANGATLSYRPGDGPGTHAFVLVIPAPTGAP